MTVSPELNRNGERGSALMVAILVSVILTLLGIAFLMMAETENRIAENERLAAQALYVAEAGARVVTRWFDRPTRAMNLPPLDALDRSLRMVDTDGDGPQLPQPVGGLIPMYKEGIDQDDPPDGDDVFFQPFRGSQEHELLGTADGPDIRIDDGNPGAARDFLADLSADLAAGFPAPARGITARVSRIDIFGPPYLENAGAWVRFGMGSVRVTARIYRSTDGGATEQVIAERVIQAVLNEVPYRSNGPFGPLHSCGDLTFAGAMGAHWGAVTATGSVVVSDGAAPDSLPRASPGNLRLDPVWGLTPDLSEYVLEVNGATAAAADFDPWFRLYSGGTITGETGIVNPSLWESWDPIDDDPPPPALPYDRSNLGGGQSHKPCPEMEYDTWKMIAGSGRSDVRYFAWSSGDQFRENGRGPARSFADITDGQHGVYFFDTTDARQPTDTDSDGDFDNLTPAIVISDRNWTFHGLVYLNAVSFQTNNVGGTVGTFRAPGEPFEDQNRDGIFDSGTESWINLTYPTGIASGDFVFFGDEASPERDPSGPDLSVESSLWGILYTSGTFEAKGTGRHYGSVIAQSGVTQTTATPGTPQIYWDASISRDWPPADWNVPRVLVTRWVDDP